jgi:hypothetical protein
MTDSPTTIVPPPHISQITIFDFGQSVREHFFVTAFPTIKAFELLHEDELLEPPPLSLESPPPDELSDDDELSEELLEQESISPKANTRIEWKKSNFSFFIEPQACAGQIILYSN